jgi:sulfoxide reductase heme-binding subunit YedZ
MKGWISKRISRPWRKNKAKLAKILHPLVHVGSAIPLLIGLWDFWQRNLGPDPIKEITHRSGKTAITLLILTLLVSPLRQILKWNQVNKLRRPLGLWAGFYALIHFTIYVALDFGFQWNLLLDNSLKNWFIWFGFTTGIIFLVLSITSLDVIKKKMGQSWKPLHKIVYLAGILAALHFILAVKPGVLLPWPYALIMLLLLAYRLPPVQAWVKKTF